MQHGNSTLYLVRDSRKFQSTILSRLQNSRFFFSKSVKKSVKRGVRVVRARSARASHAQGRLSPVSLSVFSLVPDLSFDCSRVLEYAKIRTVLQSKYYPKQCQCFSYTYSILIKAKETILWGKQSRTSGLAEDEWVLLYPLLPWPPWIWFLQRVQPHNRT